MTLTQAQTQTQTVVVSKQLSSNYVTVTTYMGLCHKNNTVSVSSQHTLNFVVVSTTNGSETTSFHSLSSHISHVNYDI